MVGVAESCLINCARVSLSAAEAASAMTYLFQSLVIQEASSIFRKIQLLALDLFPEFPGLLSLGSESRTLVRHTY